MVNVAGRKKDRLSIRMGINTYPCTLPIQRAVLSMQYTELPRTTLMQRNTDSL